jgi:hypothetical protein
MFIDQRLIALETAAVAELLQQWRSRWPGMGVLVLVPEAQKQHVPALQATCSQFGVPMYGAIFPALVTDTGFTTEGVWLLCLEDMPPCFLVESVADIGSQKLPQAVRHAMQKTAASPTTQPPPTLFMIFDGMVPNIATLLDDLHGDLDDAVVYSGVNAGSETFSPMPCLFDTHRLVGDGVLGLLLPAECRPVVKHGYPVSQRIMSATSTVGNRIDMIDGQNAFKVYQQVIQAEYGVALTRDNFYDHAVHFPFGVITAVDVLVRIPVALAEDGSLLCVGEVPPNTMLRLLRAPDLSTSDCVDKVQSALKLRGSAAGGALLTFYCAGRRMHFGDAAASELVLLKRATAASCLCGALTLGEIDSMEDLDIPRFHNAALVCMPAVPR